MELPVLYRKRYMPDETVKLKDDEIVYLDSNIIITKWMVLKPREDFSSGISWYFIDKGFKVSKFLKSSGELHYIYCDIIEHTYNKEDNSYVFIDLLADAVVYPDGRVMVMDIGELSEALDKKIIRESQLKSALANLDSLLNIIYSGRLLALLEENTPPTLKDKL